MVEKYSNPPKVAGPDKKSIPKRYSGLTMLTFYAGLVTAALIPGGVFGAMHERDNDRFQLAPDTRIKHYQKSFEKEVDDYNIDTKRDREVIYQRQINGSRRIIVLDFEKELGGVSDSDAEQCYMTRDLKGFPSAAELTELLESEQSENGNRERSVEYSIDRDDPVTDLSVVPAELQTSCWGKPVYWLQKIMNTGSRTKRQVVISVSIKIRF